MNTRGSRDAPDVEPSCEGDAHQAWTGQRRTPATMVLVVTMVALYLVEAGLGAPDYVPALVRLGALVRERVLAGEIWRLISCTFLHGSVMHLAFNMVVLWSLGQMLERILGTARFVVMYVAAGIGGSLLSLVFLKGVSVGASGALWGLMTAEMVLIWRARGILPEGLRTKMRLESMWNLGLNVINSFRPGVDWAAHAGGGFMGVAFGSLGILTRGLPGSAEAAEGAPPPPDRVPPFMRAGAWASGMVLVLGLVAAVVGGRPWEATTGPALVRTAIGTTGWTAELPIGLAPPRLFKPGLERAEELVYGDMLTDPVQLDIVAITFPAPPTPEQRESIYADLEKRFSLSDGFKLDAPMERTQAEGRVVLEGRYTGPGKWRLRRAVIVADTAVHRVDVIYWIDAPAGWDDIAGAIVLSFRAA